MSCFLFCFVFPQKVVNKSKVRRAGSRKLESRKYGIPFPSLDCILFALALNFLAYTVLTGKG
jgi:hypothetical protein